MKKQTIPAKKGFNIHDLVNVQPMMEEHEVTFALRSKVSLDSDKQVAKRGHAPAFFTKHNPTEVVRRGATELTSDQLHASKINGSFGLQTFWHLITVNDTVVVAHAKVYEENLQAQGRHRLYRWSVTPAGGVNSSAHGDCVSLHGAKVVARACANLFKLCDPFCDRKHR